MNKYTNVVFAFLIKKIDRYAYNKKFILLVIAII